MVSKQIKSKERVAEHGEVFTNEREVNAMLDMVKQETERIESRFWSLPAEMATSLQKFLIENWLLSRNSTVKVLLNMRNIQFLRFPVSTV